MTNVDSYADHYRREDAADDIRRARNRSFRALRVLDCATIC